MTLQIRYQDGTLGEFVSAPRLKEVREKARAILLRGLSAYAELVDRGGKRVALVFRDGCEDRF